MGNTHMAQRARMEADSFRSKWRTTNDFAWGYGRERGKLVNSMSQGVTYLVQIGVHVGTTTVEV